jgi:hypothetical protein
VLRVVESVGNIGGGFAQTPFKSAAAILNPDEYVNAVLPVIREDSYSSFCNKAYEKAKRAANKEQKTALDQMIDHHKIKIGKHSKY